MEIKQLEPMDIIRSEMGTWSHPIYMACIDKIIGDREYISRSGWDALKKHFNVDTVTFWMESNVNSDDWEIMMDDCDITKWEPIAPNGFFLIDINFGEDDAYAIFARPISETEVA